MKHSSFFSWNWQDFLKGLILAVGAPLLYVIQEMIPHWNISPTDKVAVSAFVTYMLKNLATPTPKSIYIDPSKTAVIDSTTNNSLIKTN